MGPTAIWVEASEVKKRVTLDAAMEGFARNATAHSNRPSFHDRGSVVFQGTPNKSEVFLFGFPLNPQNLQG